MKKQGYIGKFSRTKIIATIGPSSSKEETIRQMIQNGMRVARINLSHGTHQSHKIAIRNIRSQAGRLNLPVGILADLPGVKIRIGRLINGSLAVKSGEVFTMKKGCFQKIKSEIPVNFPLNFNKIKSGFEMFMADGFVRLQVKSVSGSAMVVESMSDGLVASGSGLSIPGLDFASKLAVSKDLKHIKFAIRNNVDFIGVSFVSSAEDIIAVKRHVRGKAFVIAKIERRKALDNLDDIVSNADGVMVARGDLGVEIPFEDVPFVQKRIVEAADNNSKPVIIATQMMESMVEHPMPTRAEVSDIARAVLEGADAVMLSGETAIGRYPADAVGILSRVLKRAEKERIEPGHIVMETSADEVSRTACGLARDMGVSFIVVPTRSGATARRISRFNPESMILALVSEKTAGTRLLVSYGVESMKIPESINSTDKAYSETLKMMKPGQSCVFVCGSRRSAVGDTDTIHLIKKQ